MALAPIAHQPGKSWPAERWGQLVEKLKAEPRFDGWRFMPVGGPGDRPPATPALEAAGEPGILGAITGRAIYEGSLDVAEGQRLCDELTQG